MMSQEPLEKRLAESLPLNETDLAILTTGRLLTTSEVLARVLASSLRQEQLQAETNRLLSRQNELLAAEKPAPKEAPKKDPKAAPKDAPNPT